MEFDVTLFLCALGLAFMLESSLYALFPEAMKKMLLIMSATPAAKLRVSGMCGLVLGMLIVWLGRSLA